MPTAEFHSAPLGKLASLPFVELLLFRNSVWDVLQMMRRHARALPPGQWADTDLQLRQLGRSLNVVIDEQEKLHDSEPDPD